MNHYIIRSYTHLPGIGKLCYGNSAGRYFKVSILFHYAGTFATKLKSYRHKFFRSDFINDPSHSSAAGLKYMIECKIVHHSRHYTGGIALAIQTIHGCKTVYSTLLHNSLCGRCKFAGFEYNAVTCRHCTNQWVDEHLDRIIPWANNEYNSKG